MRRLRWVLLAGLVMTMWPRVSGAQVTPAGGTSAPDDSQPPSSRVGAVIFYDYTYQTSPKTTDAAGNSVSPSSFNLTRAYLNVTGNLSHVVSYRITPDIASSRLSAPGANYDGSYVFRIKYAFAQFALDDWSGRWHQTWVRAGVQQTPLVDWLENVYRYRFQGTIFAERDGGLSSSDVGVSFHTNIPSNYGEFHVGFYNGEAYTKPEVNDQKALMTRITIRPLPTGGAFARAIRVTLFHDQDNAVQDAERNRTVANVIVEQRHYTAGFDYLWRRDRALPTTDVVEADGYSVFVTPFVNEKGNGFEGLLRFDDFRPNATLSPDGRQRRVIAGISYWFPHPGGNATAAVLLDYEDVSTSNITPSSTPQRRIALHGLINF